MFTKHKAGLGQANIGGAHNLERFRVLQHAVLMDAGFMRKSVLADDGLVELHGKAGHRGDFTRNGHDLRGVNPRSVGQNVIPDLHRHHHFFQGRIARPFA